MAVNKVAVKYAKSLLDFAEERQALQIFSKDAEVVLHVFSQTDEVGRFFKNPIIKTKDKAAVFTTLFKESISNDFFEFVSLMIRKGRENVLEDVLLSFVELKNEALGIIPVALTTSYPLSSEELEPIKTAFEKILNKKVIFSLSVDERLIGGFVAKCGDQIYDASLQHQLVLIKNQLRVGGPSLN
ncbi:MAG: ATP synthase F1 subunit delta [Ignavibacteriaceae bacterium]|jgi:F-type H+-transporting ATPase subunit delta